MGKHIGVGDIVELKTNIIDGKHYLHKGTKLEVTFVDKQGIPYHCRCLTVPTSLWLRREQIELVDSGVENEVVFTSINELASYNQALLDGFVDYLNNKHKKTRSVFDTAVYTQIVSKKQLVEDYNRSVIEKIKEEE